MFNSSSSDPTKQPASNAPPSDPSAAPPPYTSPQVGGNALPPSDSKNPLPQAPPTYDPNQQASSSSHPALIPQGPHILHIYKDSVFGQDLTILDSDKQTVAYSVIANRATIFSEKPHMRIYRGPPDQQPPPLPVGTASFHSSSRSIDLELHGRMQSMDSKSLISYTHQFTSGIGPLSWKGNGWGGDMILMTPGKEWIAKFDYSAFAVDKRGKLEIVNWDIQGVGLDEIVVSGVAMMEHIRRRRRR